MNRYSTLSFLAFVFILHQAIAQQTVEFELYGGLKVFGIGSKSKQSILDMKF